MSRVSKTAAKPEITKASSPAGRGKADYSRNEQSDADRYHMIATAAYYRAQHRGFAGGDPMEDWLTAEAEIDQLYH